MKFRSSLTLFSTAAAEPGVYREALAQFYGGVEDPLTRRMLDVRMWRFSELHRHIGWITPPPPPSTGFP